MRGAPHYHILLWIENAPVVGIDRPEEVCSFIQDRITCHIPDGNTSPDLNHLVTKYQMHKCSKYCKRNIKVGKTYQRLQSFAVEIVACKYGLTIHS